MDERPLLPLGGAALIRSSGYYADICALLGVETRPEGWALWHTWDDKKRATTLVTTCLTTTEACCPTGRGAYPPIRPPRTAPTSPRSCAAGTARWSTPRLQRSPRPRRRVRSVDQGQDGAAGGGDQDVHRGRRRAAGQEVAADGAVGDVDRGEDQALVVEAGVAVGEGVEGVGAVAVEVGEPVGPFADQVLAPVEQEDGGFVQVGAAPARVCRAADSASPAASAATKPSWKR